MCRRLPLYCLLDQLKIKAAVDQGFAEAKRTQKFKRGDIDIFAVAGIEDHFLRVTFGIAHTQVIAEVFGHARYLRAFSWLRWSFLMGRLRHVSEAISSQHSAFSPRPFQAE